MMVILLVGYMQTSSGIAELLREAEIDDVNKVRVLAYTHDEVCRFDVAMDEIARVDVFDARYLQQGHGRWLATWESHENAKRGDACLKWAPLRGSDGPSVASGNRGSEQRRRGKETMLTNWSASSSTVFNEK